MPLVRLTFIPQDDHGCDVFVEDLRPCDVLIAPEDMPGGDEFEKRDALRAFGPEWWGNWPCCFEVLVEVLDPVVTNRSTVPRPHTVVKTRLLQS